MRMADLKAKGAAFFRSRQGQRLLAWGRRLFVVVVLALLVRQLAAVGWKEILSSLPASPWFYVLFVVLFFSLPVTEAFIYRQLWRFRYWDGLIAFLKKRVLNKDVLGYSGDVYIYLWARKEAFLSEREILGAVKDNAIMSSSASTIFAVAVLIGLFLTGNIAWAEGLAEHEAAYAAGLLVGGGVLAALAVRFRKVLFHLSAGMLARLFGIHLARLVGTTVLQVIQWNVVMPQGGWLAWGTLLAVQIVVSRIPFLPGRDLLYVGAGVEVSRLMDISAADMAGMLLISSVLDKALNLLFFALSTLLARRKGRREEAPEPALASAPVPEAADA